MDKHISKTNTLDRTIKRLGVTAAGFFSLRAGGQLVKETSEIQLKLEALDIQLKSFSGDQYTKNVEAIDNVVKGLNLPLIQATEGFTRFNSSATLAGLEADATRQMFTGLSMASRVFQLDAQKFDRATTAIEQMLSKGRVSAEELRQQLGEHIPGAFALAAKSMNMSQEQLNKALEKGAVDSKVFVRNFGATMVEEYAGRIPAAMESTQAHIDGLNNKLIMHKAQIGDSLLPVYAKWIELKVFGLGVLKKVITWTQKHSKVLKVVGIAVGVVATALAAYYVVQKASLFLSGAWTVAQIAMSTVSAIAAGNFTAAAAGMSLLNIALLANPVFLITAGVVALVAGIVVAYKKFDKFRAIVDGVFSVVKDRVMSMVLIIKAMIAPIKALILAVKGDMDGAKQALKDGAMDAINGVKMQFDVVGSFKKGYNSSLERTAANKGKESTDGQPIWSKFAGGLGSQNGGGTGGSGGSGQFDTTVSSGRSVRNVSIRIDQGIGKIELNTTNLQQGAMDIKRVFQDMLNRALLDFESSL